MKRAISSVLATIILVAGTIFGVAVISQPQPAAAVDPLCSAHVNGNTVHVHCTLLGAVILDTNLPISVPTVRITLPPQPPKTIRATVRVPGPTRTVTAPPVNNPGATATRTVTISPSKNSSPSGQTPTSHVTITASPQVHEHTRTVTRHKTETTVHRVFIGTLVAIGLLLLAILAGIGGYYFGYKDSDKKEQNFLRALVERVRGERN